MPKRTYTYDDLGRLVSDTLTSRTRQTQPPLARPTATTLRGNLTSQNINLPGNSQSGAHNYSYDRAGRITSWTHPSVAGPVTVPIGWDRAGNRTGMGADTYSYDQRNRLTTSTEQVGGILPVTITSISSCQMRQVLSESYPPSTIAYPVLTDRTFTNLYDSGALQPRSVSREVSIARSFDELGRLIPSPAREEVPPPPLGTSPTPN